MTRPDKLINRLIRYVMYSVIARNPTSKFSVPLTAVSLNYDFDRKSLNGASYHSNAEDLKNFGPASAARHGPGKADLSLIYNPLGMEIALDAMGVVYFSIAFTEDWSFNLGSVKPCGELTLTFSDRRSEKLRSQSSTKDFEALFGAPCDRFEITPGIELYSSFVLNGNHIIATHTVDGNRLLNLVLAESA